MGKISEYLDQKVNIQVSQDAEETLLRSEHSGQRLAIMGRTVVLFLLGVWLVATRAEDATRAYGYFMVITVFLALGLAHYFLIGSAYDRRWVKYVFVTIDIALMSILIATQPLFYTAPDLPQTLTLQNPYFPYYFVILGVTAFSFSPFLVIWTGLAGAIGWLSAFVYITRNISDPLSWNDIPNHPNAQQVMDVLLNPNFAGPESRLQETLLLLVVALSIATVMWRARKTLKRQLDAERERRAISGMFGRFVPQAVVDSLISGKGVLEPVESEATVLFVDIANFTRLTERVGPAKTVDVLNSFFEEVTRIIGRHNGVITQYQGDAVLATFNVPIEDTNHGANAVLAAGDILDCVASRMFGEEQLHVRIGINTGPLIAGNVGGDERQSYTVHGNTVNIAVRLQSLCKDFDKPILISATTAGHIRNIELEFVGSIPVRGLTEALDTFTFVDRTE
ncbi:MULTISPECIES: adenylate/guanylate cyclase domain-containing protein [Alphaproteobacteria]|uniref:adenylate/guanylate cyclase domain-containing protein n=1 Tax=Alphaproteobacteria TaxID=28211 RepID=UPI003A8E6C25